MKKQIIIVAVCLLCVILCSCADEIIDISALNAASAHTTLQGINDSPMQYKGKTVKITGTYDVFINETLGEYYPRLCLYDANGLNEEYMVFRLPDSTSADYPEEGETVTVVGVVEIYQTNEQRWCYLKDAQVIEE